MSRTRPLVPVLNLLCFGIAFGLIEAAVVIYLRALFGMEGDSLFPLRSHQDERVRLIMEVELLREAATLVLMLAPAWLFDRRPFMRFLAYALIFGIWDLSYYAFLKLLLGWPASLFTYDVLFLLPTVWVAPVLCPVLISLALAGFAGVCFYLEAKDPVASPRTGHWLAGLAGGGLVLFSFMKEAAYYLEGGMPPRFPWLPFLAGFLLAATAAGHYLYRQVQPQRSRFD